MMKQNEAEHAQAIEEKEEIIQKLGMLLKTTTESLKSLRDCSRDAVVQRDQRISEVCMNWDSGYSLADAI